MKKNIISAAEAARMLGCPAQKVRERMKRGIWKIGVVRKNGSNYTYDVSVQKLDALLKGEVK